MKKILSFCVAISISSISYAQTQSSNPIDIDDAKALIEAYISPLGNSLGAGLNNGWYNTAKPHKLGGFDVTLTANFVLITEEVKSFTIKDIVKGGMFNGNGSSSTILGGNNEDGLINLLLPDSTTTVIQLPNGLDIPTIPLPMLQAGIGLIKGTEVNVRYIPDLKFGNSGKVGVIGFGIKHDILQWLPIVDKVPIDLSIQAGYTKITSNIELIDPSGNISTPTIANLDIAATTINLLLSKKLLMFTPYVGVGYNSSKTSFFADGKYNFVDDQYIPVEALTEFEFETKNNLRANIGFRFNITILALQANYTFSEYPTATLGIGISVR